MSLELGIEQSAIYWRQTVAIFPLSERVVNNIEQPEEMGHASTDVTQHYGEVDAAVTFGAQEEGEGRDERKKQRAWEEAKTQCIEASLCQLMYAT